MKKRYLYALIFPLAPFVLLLSLVAISTLFPGFLWVVPFAVGFTGLAVAGWHIGKGME
jgi:hypothetical protein